jgi:hypothetical protein
MQSFITAHDLANMVRMAHSQRRVTFVLVEGTTDVTFFARFVAEGACEVVPCFGRPNVLAAVALLDQSREAGFLAIVDADWDRVAGRSVPSPNCIWTDNHDVIVDLLCSSALDRLLAERGSSTKIQNFERAGRSVRDAILEEAAEIGRLRWHNDATALALTFSELEVHRFVSGELAVDVLEVTRVVVQRSRSSLRHTDLVSACESMRDHDVRQVASGHDAVSILSVGLCKQLGNQRHQDVKAEVLELELRLAFDDGCLASTAFYSAIRAWESSNPEWRVLR